MHAYSNADQQTIRKSQLSLLVTFNGPLRCLPSESFRLRDGGRNAAATGMHSSAVSVAFGTTVPCTALPTARRQLPTSDKVLGAMSLRARVWLFSV
mmetsp:Transcript_11599/g.25519  ORF Transcript_11599/g.25519 Transcript_11599/m.25519 type:complete len:96 (+) Transcript_11599:2-289(+)